MSSQTLEVQTYFDQWVASVPGPFQGPLSVALSPLESLIEQVSGDPHALVAAAGMWTSTAPTLTELFTDQRQTADQLLELWESDAIDRFEETIATFEESANTLVEVMEQTGEFLVEAAEALVAAFNAIVEIIIFALLLLLGKYIVAAAASIITFGASVAAAIADTFATMAITAGRVIAVIGRLAPIFQRIAWFLRSVSLNAALYGGLIQTLQRLGGMANRLKAMLLAVPIHGGIKATTGAGTGAGGHALSAASSLRDMIEENREALRAAGY